MQITGQRAIADRDLLLARSTTDRPAVNCFRIHEISTLLQQLEALVETAARPYRGACFRFRGPGSADTSYATQAEPLAADQSQSGRTRRAR